MSKVDESYLDSWGSIVKKLCSNIVQLKLWLSAAGFYAMLIGMLNPYAWIGLVSLLYGLGKATKMTWMKNLRGENTTEPEGDENTDIG